MSDKRTGNHEVGLLKGNSAVMEELAEALKETDLVKFSQELQNMKVLSLETVQGLGSLDFENLDHGVTSRYLIHLICEAMATEEGVRGKLVELLSGLGEIMKKICHKWIKEFEVPPTEVLKYPEDICLKEDNLPLLINSLADLASKWKEICAALQLPAAVLEECESKGTTDYERLVIGLRAWIMDQHDTALPANLNSLGLALGENENKSDDIVQKIKSSFSQEVKLDRSTNLQKGANLEFSWQSEDTVVSEGKSALLEVRVARTDSPMKFHWLKEGQELADSEDYSGTTNSLLLIRGQERVQGNYSCQVSNEEKEISSRNISLIIISSLRDKNLVDLYSSLEEALVDRWPSATSCTFNNLTLAKYMIGENSQLKGNCFQAFDKVETGTLILVKGCSGAGKTILAYKLTTDWSKGKVLTQMKNVFLITTAMLSTLVKCQHLSDILKMFYKDQTKQNVLLGEIERSFGKGSCFIIDGLYEPPKADSNFVLHNLLLKKYLPEAVAIVMSSLIDASRLPQSAKTIVPMELANFTHEEIFQHIDNFPFHGPNEPCDEDTTDPLSLMDYIYMDSTVLHMCTVPVHASMACYIHENGTCHLSTLTSLYNQFIQIHILDQLKGRGKDTQFSQDLKDKNQAYFKGICKTAFRMTVNQQRAFSQRDLEMPLPESSSHISFIFIDYLSKKLGLERTHTFLHQTLQEFLAAFHISQLERKDQEELIREHAHKPFMKSVWQFFSGLSIISQLSATCLEKLLPKAGLDEMHCAFESQLASICDRVMESSEDGCIDLSGNILSPYDLSAMQFVISRTTQPVKNICLNNCTLGDRFLIEVISQVPDDKLATLEKMHLSNNNIGSLGATALADRLKHLPKESRNVLPATGESNRITLQVLDLSRNNLGSDGAISLVYGLQQVMTNLQELNISHNGLGSGGVMAVLNDMIKIRSLKILNLSHNHIDSETALIIIHAFLQDCHTLQVLNIEEDNTPDNVSDIKEELSEHRSRLEVRLSQSVTLRSSLRSNQSCCRVT